MPVPFKTPCRLTTLLCPKGEARPVWEVNNENEYEALLKEKQGSLYEMVGDGMKVNAYLDCDILLSYDEYNSLVGPDGVERYFINSNVTDKYGIATIRKIINDIPMFKNKTRFEMFREPRMVKDKCKFSYRFVIDIPFKSNKHIKRYLESLNFKNNEPFDLSVYNDGRIMNSVHSTKDFLCSLPLKPAEFQKTLPVENFLITCVNPDHPVVAIEEPKKIETVKSIKKYIDEEAEDVDIDSIKGLLSCIPSNIGYQDWFKCMTGVKTITNDSQEGYNIADDWSATDSSYDARGFARTWKSAKMGTVNMGTLIHYAKEHNLERFNTEWLPKFGTKMLNPYEKMKNEFEEKVFKIVNPVCFYQFKTNGEYTITSSAKIKETYCDMILNEKDKNGEDKKTCFIDKWLKDPKKRSYEYVEFDPIMKSAEHIYNSFTGFRASKIEQSADICIELIINHFKLLFKEHYMYVIKWFAQIIQHPNKKPNVCLIFQSSKEGAGKTILVDWFAKKIMGERYYRSITDPANDLFSKHGNAINERLLINLEEAQGQGFRPYMDRFKELITGSKYRIEPKGVDAYEIPNYCSFVANTNNDNPIPISATDRRFCAFNCDHDKVRNIEYFTELANAMSREEVVRAFYDYLMTLEIDINNFQEARPETDYYKELKRTNIPNWAKYFSKRCDDMLNIEPPTDMTLYTGSCLYNDYTQFCQRCKYEPLTNTNFALKVKKIQGIEKERSKNGVKYNLNWENIKTWLEKENMFDEEVF